MSSDALVTVVVPVYNVEPYLSQCLQSIVSQSYRNLEILVVDDGSTDVSGELCDQWAQRDKRITVVHQPNGGLSAARNTALDTMHGDYVTMVDSDDVLASNDSVAVLLHLLQQHDADVVVGKWMHFDNKVPAVPTTSGKDDSVRCYDSQQALSEILYQRSITNSSCSRLFDARLFDQVRYPKGKLYEDVAIVYPLIKRARKVVTTDHLVYFYRQRPGSILQRFTPARADILDILEQLEGQLQDEQPRLLPAVRSRLLSAYFNILLLNEGCETPVAGLSQRCWQGIRRLRGGCLRDPMVRLKNKAGIMASHMGQRTFCKLFSHNYHPNQFNNHKQVKV